MATSNQKNNHDGNNHKNNNHAREIKRLRTALEKIEEQSRLMSSGPMRTSYQFSRAMKSINRIAKEALEHRPKTTS